MAGATEKLICKFYFIFINLKLNNHILPYQIVLFDYIEFTSFSNNTKKN